MGTEEAIWLDQRRSSSGEERPKDALDKIERPPGQGPTLLHQPGPLPPGPLCGNESPLATSSLRRTNTLRISYTHAKPEGVERGRAGVSHGKMVPGR